MISINFKILLSLIFTVLIYSPLKGEDKIDITDYAYYGRGQNEDNDSVRPMSWSIWGDEDQEDAVSWKNNGKNTIIYRQEYDDLLAIIYNVNDLTQFENYLI